MCFAGAAGPGLQAAQMVVGFIGQQQTYANQEQQFNQNTQNALSDNRITESRLQAQEMEENASYSQKDQLALNEGAEKEAQARTAAATWGVVGNSVAEVVNGVGEQINLKRDALQTNWQSQVEQTESAKVSGVAQEQSRVGEVANPYSPSVIGTLLGVASQGVTAGATPSGQSWFNSLSSGGTNSTGSGLNVGDAAGAADSVGGASAAGIGMM